MKHKAWSRVLSMFLAIVLLLSMVPSIQLFASAVDNRAGLQFSDDYLRTDKPIVGSPDTLEFWINVPSDMTSSVYLLGDYMSAGSSFEDLSFEIHNGGNKLTVYWNGPAVYNGECVFPKDVWTHVALVRNAETGVFTLYFNGEEKLVFEKTADAIEGTRPITIGNYTGGGANRQFNGMLSDVRIWSESRTQDQIKADMTNKLTGNEENLLANWRLDKEAGTLAYRDYSPNKNHAYFAGGDPDSVVEEEEDAIKGLQFSDDYLRTDKPIVGSPDTLEFWINVPSDMTSSVYLLGDYMSQGSSFEDLSFEIHNGGNKLTIYWNGPAVYNGECVFPKDVWTHVALVRDAETGVFTLYFNGEEKLVFEKTGAAIEGTRPITIGNYTGGGANRQFNGMLADVRIWNESRTQDEIKLDMKAELTGLEENLLAWWKLDEADGALTFRDYSANKNHAYFEGGDPDSIVDGDEGDEEEPEELKGLQFSDDYLRTDKPISGSPDTLEFWINVPSDMNDSVYLLGDYMSQGNSFEDLSFEIHNNGNKLTIYWNGPAVYNGECVFPKDVWTHVALVRNAETGIFVLYFNGEEKLIFEKTSGAIEGTRPITIGNFTNGGANRQYNGMLADIRIWSESRTQEQIQADMTSAPTGREANLLAWWKLDEADGALTFKDYSANKNHAYFDGGDPSTIVDETPAPDGLQFSDDYLRTDKPIAGSPDTLEFWINVPSDMTSSVYLLGDYMSQGSSLEDLSFEIHNGGNKLTLYWNGPAVYNGECVFPKDVWTHVALVRNAETGVFTLYFNGEVQLVFEKTSGAIEGTRPITIGNYTGGGANRQFNGMLADIRIWSESRTQEQVKQDMLIDLNGDEANLLAYWKLDEADGALTFKDYSVNANHAYFEGGDPGTIDPEAPEEPEEPEEPVDPPVEKDGLQFADDYLRTDKPIAGSPDTLEFWINVPSNMNDSVYLLGDYMSQGNSFEDLSFEIHNAGNKLTIYWNGPAVYNGECVFPKDVWTHVALVRDAATNVFTLYFNGEVKLVFEKTSGAIEGTRPITIGNYTGGGANRQFNGMLADIRIWSESRTQDQIKADMTNTLTGNEANLLACWKLDEADGALTFKDYSTNKNHAYFEGGNPGTIDPEEPEEPEEPEDPVDPPVEKDGLQFADDYLRTDKPIAGSPDTLEFWINIPSNMNDSVYLLGDYMSQGNSFEDLSFEIHNNGNKLTVYWNGPAVYNGECVFPKDVWTHVALVRDAASNVFTLYFNGEVKLVFEKTSGAIEGTRPITMGNYTGGGANRQFNGMLADIRIWNESRTQEQIKTDMTTAPAGTETSLLAWWKLDEADGALTFKDYSANENHAYFEGGKPGSGNEDFREPDHLVGFDFNETRLETSTVIPGSPDTIEVWVKVPSNTTAARAHIFGDYDYNGNGLDSLSLELYNEGQALRIWWGTEYIYQGSYNFATDKWTHIALVRDAETGTFTVYINGGIHVVLDKAVPGLAATTNPIGIGGDWRAAPCFFDGYIADLRMWSEARTQDQIKEDMYNTLTGNEENLLANWKLDEGADAKEFKDCSANGIHAKLQSWSSGDEEPDIGDIEFTTDHLVGHKFDGESYFATHTPVGDVVNSFEFWMQVPADVEADRMHVFGDWQYKGNQFESVSVDIYSDGNAFRLAWNDSYLMQGGVSVKGGDWVHVAVSRNTETGYIYLYINGEMVMRTYQVADAITAIKPIAIGADWRAGGHYFKGTIADLRFWSDTRTQKEIVDNMSKYLNGDEEGLLANWKFDVMHEGEVYKDSGSKNIDATLKRTWFSKEDPTGDYSIVIIPDTQHYACYDYPEMHEQMMQWLVDNAEKENIQFALHVGDFTNCDAAYEWERARKAMSILDGVIPYYMVVGNHDYPLISSIRDAGLYNRFFPYDKFSKWETFGGAFEEGKMDNVYYYENMGGVDYLIICLEFGPRQEVMAWAEDLVVSHPNHKVIMVTHSYLCGDGTHASKDTDCVCEGSSYGYADRFGNTVVDGDQMWKDFVSKHENILFTFNGHDDGMYVRIDEGVNGNKVYQFLVDSQSTGTGGDGLMCILRFREDGTVTSSYYSPLKDQYYMTDCQFELDMSKELIQDIADNYNARMEALPADASALTMAQAADVVALAEGMAKLTETQKALLNAELVEKVNALAEAAEEKLNAIAAVEEMIAALPHVSDLTLNDADAVKAAEAAYNALSEEEKALVNTTLVNKLNSLKAKLSQLSEGNQPDIPATGDSMLIGLAVLAMLMAAAAVLVLSRKRRSV